MGDPNDFGELLSVFYSNELNIIEAVSVISDKEESQDIVFNLKLVLESIERKYLENALVKYSGNQVQAARFLGLNRTTFIEKIRKYQIKSAIMSK